MEQKQVFISHIADERDYAYLLKEALKEAFQGTLRVFVASDLESIPSGRPWFDEIIKNLKQSEVILTILSQESKIGHGFFLRLGSAMEA